MTHGSLRHLIVSELVRDRRRAIGAILTVLVSGAVVAAGPIAMRYGLDEGISAGDRGALRIAVLASAALLVAGGLVGGLRSLLMVSIGQRFLHELRCNSLAGLLRLNLGEYEASRRGDLQARVTSDVESLASASESLIPDLARDAVLVIGGFVAVGVLAPKLIVLALAVVPPALLAGRWLVRRSQVVYPALLRQNGVAFGRLAETIEGSATIAAMNAEGRQLDHLRAADDLYVGASATAATMRNWFYSVLLVIQSVGTAGVVVGAGVLVDGRGVTVGTAAAAILALAAVYGPLSIMIGRMDDVLSARAALQRVVELTNVVEPSSTGAPLPARGALHLDGVSYRYENVDDQRTNRLAVDDVSLTIEAGEHLAVVGMTGSGKSTLARLAVGLATPHAGVVTVGGTDLCAAAETERRHRLLLIPQETFLLSGSIADNARLAQPDLDDAAVECAVDDLGVRSWIDSLPEGIATDVGPAGGRLSAGERQLVTLLRVALADPAVIVLDEATSVLDPASEAAISNALARLSEGRATIVIAHRPDTAARCDWIAVMDGGRVVQLGTHAELAAGDGPYVRLWNAAFASDP